MSITISLPLTPLISFPSLAGKGRQSYHFFKTLMQLRNLYLVNFSHYIFPCLAHYNRYSGHTMNINTTRFSGEMAMWKTWKKIHHLFAALFFAAHLSADWCGLPASVRHLWAQHRMYSLCKNAAYRVIDLQYGAKHLATLVLLWFGLGFFPLPHTLSKPFLWLLFKHFIWFPLLGVFCLLKMPA